LNATEPAQLVLTPDLKLFKRLLHDSKGDANLQGFRVTDPLEFQSSLKERSRGGMTVDDPQ
jgi:hypothetical protein